MKVKLNLNHWRYRLLHWTFGAKEPTFHEIKDGDPFGMNGKIRFHELPLCLYTNYCPLFNLTNLLVLCIPLTYLIHWMYYVYERCQPTEEERNKRYFYVWLNRLDLNDLDQLWEKEEWIFLHWYKVDKEYFLQTARKIQEKRARHAELWNFLSNKRDVINAGIKFVIHYLSYIPAAVCPKIEIEK